MSEQKNIYQRLNAVKSAVAYVRKDKKVGESGGYMAVTHDAVTAETRPAFIDHGVMIVPCELSSETKDSGMVTGKGNPIIRFEAKYRVDFVNVDAPDDKVSVELTAHALDQGDKAPGKAHSYATKYAVLKVLQLETGEDEEARETGKPKKHEDIPLPMTPITPTAGAMESIDQAGQSRLVDLANVVKEYGADKDWEQAVKIIEDAALDADHKTAFWTLLDSKTRSALKKAKADMELATGMQP